MTLWAWAGEAWRRPGFEAACLTLQDDHGQCAPLLLWALWLIERGSTPDDAEIDRAVVLCRTATSSTIEPLRQARRGAAPADRDRLLADELAAERELLETLSFFAPACGGNKAAKPTQRGRVFRSRQTGAEPPTLAEASRLPRVERGQRSGCVALAEVSRLWGRSLDASAFDELVEALRVGDFADV